MIVYATRTQRTQRGQDPLCGRCFSGTAVITSGEIELVMLDHSPCMPLVPVCPNCLTPAENIEHGERLLAVDRERFELLRRDWLAAADSPPPDDFERYLEWVRRNPAPALDEVAERIEHLEETLDDLRYVARGLPL